MVRKILLAVLCFALFGLAGCAAVSAESPPPEWQPRLEDMARSQTRLEMRVDEITRSLLILREKLEAQEAALKQVREEREKEAPEEAPPPLEVIKVEPLAQEGSGEQKVSEAPAPQPSPGKAGAEAPQAARPAPRSAPDRAGPADLYRRAFSAFRDGRFGQAILDFEEFLRKYPAHEYADNAQYWTGECYYSQREFSEAIVEFGRVLERYPRGKKAPDALLKIGLSYQQLGEPERAKTFWKRTLSEFSGSEAAVQAKKFLGAPP